MKYSPRVAPLLISLAGLGLATSYANEYSLEKLPIEAIYAVLEIEIRTSENLYDGTHKVFLGVEGEDPSPEVLYLARTLYAHLYPKSGFKMGAGFNVNVSFEESSGPFSLNVKYGCYSGCGYEAIYRLEMSSGNWVATSARYKMQ